MFRRLFDCLMRWCRSAGLHRAFCSKLRYGVPIVSKLFEDFFSVGAQQRGWRNRLWICAGQTEPRADHGDSAIGSRRSLKVLDQAALYNLRMFEYFGYR